MINKRKFFIVFPMILAFGMLFFGCDPNPDFDKGNDTDTGTDTDTTNKGGVYLTGTYGRYMVSQGTYNDRLIFTETTFSSQDRSGQFLSGTYKYDGAILTFTINGVKHNRYANVSGTTIVISGDGAYEFLNGKWSKR